MLFIRATCGAQALEPAQVDPLAAAEVQRLFCGTDFLPRVPVHDDAHVVLTGLVPDDFMKDAGL